jgi:hypothetical protein
LSTMWRQATFSAEPMPAAEITSVVMGIGGI